MSFQSDDAYCGKCHKNIYSGGKYGMSKCGCPDLSGCKCCAQHNRPEPQSGAKKSLSNPAPPQEERAIVPVVHKSTPVEDVVAIVGPPHCKIAEEETGQFNEVLEKFYKEFNHSELFLKMLAITKALMDHECETCKEAKINIGTKYNEAIIHYHKEKGHWDLHSIPQGSREPFDPRKGKIQISGECELKQPDNSTVTTKNTTNYIIGFNTENLHELKHVSINKRMLVLNGTRNPVFNMKQNEMAIESDRFSHK